jgi:hypothetical protein
MKYIYLLGLTVIVGLSACNSNSNNEQASLLEGVWLFESGSINQGTQGTELLKNLLFEFKQHQFTCELLPEMHNSFKETESYSLSEGIINIKDRLSITIKSISQDHLKVAFSLRSGDDNNTYLLLFSRQ